MEQITIHKLLERAVYKARSRAYKKSSTEKWDENCTSMEIINYVTNIVYLEIAKTIGKP